MGQEVRCEECNRVKKTFLHNCSGSSNYNEVFGCPVCDDRCSFCIEENEIDDEKNEMNDRAEEVWSELADIPIDNDGYTEIDFMQFPAGTDRECIWKWIEEEFDVSVGDMMYNKQQIHQIEIYIGYTDNRWDTDYIDVPNNIMDEYANGKDITNELARIYKKHLNEIEIELRKGMTDIAFIGIYNIQNDYEEE